MARFWGLFKIPWKKWSRLVRDCFSPQLCVGFLFLILYPGPPPPASSHTIFHTQSITNHLPTIFTYHLFTHHLSHTIFHTPSLRHQLPITIFVNNHLSHTIFHTPSLSHQQSHHQSLSHHLCQPSSFTYIFVKPSVSTIFVNHLCQPPTTIFLSTIFVNHHLSHTYFNHLCQPPSLTYIFVNHLCQPSLSRHFAWQAWHLVKSTFVLRGRRGTW